MQFIHFAKCTGTGNEVSGGHHTVQCGYRNVLFQQTNSTVCGRLNEMQPNAKCCPANVNSLCAACSSCIQFCIQFALQTRQIWLELKLHWYSSILQIRYTGDQRIDRVIRMSYKIGNVLHIKLAWWKYVVYYLYITFCTYSCKTWEFENKMSLSVFQRKWTVSLKLFSKLFQNNVNTSPWIARILIETHGKFLVFSEQKCLLILRDDSWLQN